MMELPGLTQLRILPGRLAAEQAAAAAGPARITAGFSTFADVFAVLAGAAGGRYVAPLACRCIVRKLAVAAGGELARLGRDPWWVRGLHRSLSELRAAGVTAQHFAGLSVSAPLAQLVTLLGGYERELEGRGLSDTAERHRLAVLALARGELPAWWRGLQRVTVEGEVDVFGARLDLLRAFAARGIDVQVRLPWDPGRPAAFAYGGAAMHAIESCVDTPIALQFDDRTGTGPLAGLRAAQLTAGERAPGAPVRLVQCTQPLEEARQVARTIWHWQRQGVAADAMCVATPDLDGLGRLVVEQLRRLGVPAYMGRGPSLSQTAPGRAMQAALRLTGAGYPREDLIDLWLSLGRHVAVGGGAVGAWSASRVARQLRAAGVRSAAVGGYRRPLLEAAGRRTGHGDATQAKAAAEAVARDIRSLLQQLDGLPSAASLDGLVTGLRRLWQQLAVPLPQSAARPGDPDGAELERRRLLRALSREHEAHGRVSELLDALHEAARTAADPVAYSREELAALWEVLAGETRLAPEGVRAGSVLVVGLEALPQTDFRRVVLAGIDAGRLPRPAGSDPVLTDALRAEINRHLGVRLVQAQPLTGREALPPEARDLGLWLEALACCDEELVVTYCVDEGADHGGRSMLVQELERSTDTAAALPPARYSQAEVASWEEGLLRWAGTCAGRGPRLGATVDAAYAAELSRALRGHDVGRLQRLEQRVQLEAARRRGEGRALSAAAQQTVQDYLRHTLHSPSRLDELAICAYRYFAKVMLRLDIDELPRLGADPREEGTAAHALLQRIYADLVARGGLRAARGDPAAAIERARQVFEGCRTAILAEVAVHPLLEDAALEGAWEAALRVLQGDLAADDVAEPQHLELSFGRDDDGAGGVAVPALVLDAPEGRAGLGALALRVHGQIDRVDRAGDTLVVLDYKRTVKAREAGRHLQLPIYTAALLRGLPEAAAVTDLQAGWIGLGDGKRKAASDMASQPDAFWADLDLRLWGRLEGFFAGALRPDPAAAVHCTRCNFAALCRYDAALQSDDTEGDG